MPWTRQRRPLAGTGPSSCGRRRTATWPSMWRSRTQGWGCARGLKSGCSSRSSPPNPPAWEWGSPSPSRSSRRTAGPSGPRTTRRGGPRSTSPCRSRREGRDRSSTPGAAAGKRQGPRRQDGSEQLLHDEVVHEEAASDVLLHRLADRVAVAPVGVERLLVGLVHSQDHAGQSAAPRLILDVPERERAESASMIRDLEIELVQPQLASGHLLVCAVAEGPVFVEQQLVDDAARDLLAQLRGVVHPGEHVLDLPGGKDGGKVSAPDASCQLRYRGEIGIGRRHAHARSRSHSREMYPGTLSAGTRPRFRRRPAAWRPWSASDWKRRRPPRARRERR